MLNKILAPLDGSELSEGILPYVSHLARGVGAKLTLMSVIDPRTIEIHSRLEAKTVNPEAALTYDPETAGMIRTDSDVLTYPSTETARHTGPYASQVFERVERNVTDSLEKIVKELAEKGIDADTRVAFGNIAEEIVSVAEKEGYSLIAMSTHARTTLGRGILGSVTDRVVHTSHVPVLTMRPEMAAEYNGAIKTLLVPLDGFSLAESVLPYVEDIARRMSLKVVLIEAVDMGLFSAPMTGHQYIGTTPLDEELEREASEYLKKTAENLGAKGLDVEWKVLKGNPAKAIVELARETADDMVVMATTGRSGLARLLVGSITDKVVRSSGDPVLIVPPPEIKRD